ncbi:hypothetical protein C8J57DRAFT_1351644 [Mycena rebaudengoi]|nr:hypothetical protein C8J57DRAFT_1351644 [Mycena rebaudengoi]
MSPPIGASTPIDDEALFRYLAWSPKKIRTTRNGIVAFCSACFKSDEVLGRPLRRCGKCHIVSYCSKECQTKNWPEHKQTCGEAGIPKLVRTLMSNPVLLVSVQSCFILAFDLLHRTRRDELLLALLDVAVEPSDIVDFADIFLGEGSSKKKV